MADLLDLTGDQWGSRKPCLLSGSSSGLGDGGGREGGPFHPGKGEIFAQVAQSGVAQAGREGPGRESPFTCVNFRRISYIGLANTVKIKSLAVEGP